MTTSDAPIYLDHNATTPLLPEVVEAMLPYLREHFGKVRHGQSTGSGSARMLRVAGVASLAAALACDGGGRQSLAGDAGTPDMPAAPADGGVACPPDLDRGERAEPVDAAELAEITGLYADLLVGTRYFAFVDERAHGWPESDPEGRFWYGTWWSGVQVLKEGGLVTYRHGADGADNNGLRTAPLLEGACYAYLLWGDPAAERLARKLVRGFASWILATERAGTDPAGPLLARAAYPESVESADGGRRLRIDYSLNRPGLDNDATQYVHLPDNSRWGDIWIKNKRSKDDLGHMMRALVQIGACAGAFANAAARAEYADTLDRYAAFARRVEDDGWAIATYDQAGEVWIPPDLLAHFVTDFGNPECNAVLALRLLGRGDPGDFDCGSGIGELDGLISESSSSNGQIMRSFHEAAANMARMRGRCEVARPLVEGLATRIETTLDRIEAGDPPRNLGMDDFAQLLVHAVNIGVPLTWREVRWLHDRIRMAASYLDAGNAATYRVFDPATPDGVYAFDPAGTGLDFKDLGALLGSCTSPWLNAASKPIFDCERLRGASPFAAE